MFNFNDRFKFDIETLIRRGNSAQTTREYNADLRRLLPWTNHVETRRKLTEFGAILVTVSPYEDVDSHRHDEEECFIVISGKAKLMVENQTTDIGVGDVVYMPRFWIHQLQNIYDIPFHFIDLYWDNKERSFEEFRNIADKEDMK